MPPENTGTGPLSGARLLLVEDQAIIALDLEELLVERGAASVSWARDVAQARALLAAGGRFDAALLDIHLGAQSGLDLLDEFQANDIPVVLISGYSSDTPGQHRLRNYPMIEKPYDPEILVRRVLEAFRPGTPLTR